MAYRALYRTYRPKTFDQVVGQTAIVKTLQNALKDGKIAHAYLFCGPRGTGKTTMARLFAKALNCSEGVGHECNKCENCMKILDGQHPDVFEIDAASNSGVDNVRQLIEQVSYAPILGRYKVYIIDEVHSMSGAAFNALLKTLEEPPANVVFILATTEPDKVLPTILSRVQRYDFSKVGEPDLIKNMENILAQEKVTYDEGALKIIARLSQGGVRDSLSLLDQAISYGGEHISEQDVNALFGLLKTEDELELVKMIHLNDIKGAINLVKEKYAGGADILKLHADLTNIYKDLLVFGTTRDPSLLTYLKKEEALTTLVTPSEIRRNLNILIQTRRDYKSAMDAFDQFELTLISLALKDNAAAAAPANAVAPETKDAEETKPQEVLPPPTHPTIVQFHPAGAEEVKKPEPAPTAVPSSPAFKPDDEPRTIRTASIDASDVPIDTSKGFTVDQKMAINIMVQGNKMLKNQIIAQWEDKLNSIPASDETAFIAGSIVSCHPVIAAEGVLVIDSVFKSTVKTVNTFANQTIEKALMKRLFNQDMVIVAIYHSDFVDYVKAFSNMGQVNALPKPGPIVIPSAPSSNGGAGSGDDKGKETNAQAFMNSLNINNK
jgi:DNA polymerase-3 subunit gamma/tau